MKDIISILLGVINKIKDYINKLKLWQIILLILIIILLTLKLYHFRYNNKLIKGGQNTCSENYITSIIPNENNVTIYYTGKIYNIKKSDLREDQIKYFSYLQELVKDGYEFDKTPENKEDKEIYSVKNYKDLTKFFNYLELIKKTKYKLGKWENLYNSKNDIIEMLKNINVKDILCINNIK